MAVQFPYMYSEASRFDGPLVASGYLVELRVRDGPDHEIFSLNGSGDVKSHRRTIKEIPAQMHQGNVNISARG